MNVLWHIVRRTTIRRQVLKVHKDTSTYVGSPHPGSRPLFVKAVSQTWHTVKLLGQGLVKAEDADEWMDW
jgi:hypothetical protein